MRRSIAALSGDATFRALQHHLGRGGLGLHPVQVDPRRRANALHRFDLSLVLLRVVQGRLGEGQSAPGPTRRPTWDEAPPSVANGKGQPIGLALTVVAGGRYHDWISAITRPLEVRLAA